MMVEGAHNCSVGDRSIVRSIVVRRRPNRIESNNCEQCLYFCIQLVGRGGVYIYIPVVLVQRFCDTEGKTMVVFLAIRDAAMATPQQPIGVNSKYQ